MRKIERKFIRFPENLELKAKLTVARMDITALATQIGFSREWINKVLNGHTEGKEVIKLIKEKLEENEKLVECSS